MKTQIIEKIINESIKNIIFEKLSVENPIYDIENVYEEIVQRIHELKSWQSNYSFKIYFNNVSIYVTLYNNKNYGGALSYGINLSIDLPFDNPDFDIIKEIVYHELTHYINQTNSKRLGKNFPGVATYDDYVNKVRDVLYRLWNRDERVAYLCRSLRGVQESKKYIERLRKEIYDIETLSPSMEIDKNTELLIWDRLIPSYVSLPFKTPMKRKNFFIKKSKYLLNWFEKKLLKNAYRLEIKKN